MKKFTYVNGDEWDGFYVNGMLVWEHHTLRISDLIELLKKHGVRLNIDEIGLTSEQQAHMEDCGHLPKYLDELDCKSWTWKNDPST